MRKGYGSNLQITERGGAKMGIPRAEQLRIIQQVHAKWTETFDDRDDVESNDAYYKMLDEAMAEAERRYEGGSLVA